MTQDPSVEDVQEADDYYQVKYWDEDTFADIRTPNWASDPAQEVCDGAKVRTGHQVGDHWKLQSVLVPKENVEDNNEASSEAQEVVEKIHNSN
jgi:hypothetical protein